MRIDIEMVDQPPSGGDSRANPVRSRAQRLRHAMNLRGVGANRLDQMADLGGGWTSRFLTEKKPNPGADKLRRICDALHIRFEWLLDGVGMMDSDVSSTSSEQGPTTSSSRLIAPASTSPRHPDVEATVRLYRNRKKWSEAALVLADEIAASRHTEPEHIVEMLDELEDKLNRIRGDFRK